MVESIHSAARLVRISLSWLILLLLVAFAVWCKQGDYQLLSVQSNSMEPSLQKGDAVVVKPVVASQLTPGSIVSYHSPANPRVVVSHRLIAVDKNRKLLITKGDNLKTTDPPIALEALVGQAVAVAPGCGRVLDFLHTKLGLAILVYLPALGVVVWELRLLLRRASAKTYRRYGYR